MSENWKEELKAPLLIGAAVIGLTSIGMLIIYIKQKSKTKGQDTVDSNKVAFKPKTHIKARGPSYPRESRIKKVTVTPDRVSWDKYYPDYKPVYHTAASVKAQPVWADPDIRTEKCKLSWNSIDGDTDRRSHMGKYEIVNGLPRNPVGRTGMYGRGLLGKWGPNHAADPIVTRWKRAPSGQVVLNPNTRKPILQFVAIERKDSGEWAIPGGMVEAGDSISLVLKKEFAEEAMNLLESTDSQKDVIQNVVDDFFTHGNEIYRGYVDDPRNTDNSWMETVAVNFHDDTGDGVGKFHLHAGDDASKVQWTDIDGNLRLYASHADFIKKVAKLHNCHWG